MLMSFFMSRAAEPSVVYPVPREIALSGGMTRVNSTVIHLRDSSCGGGMWDKLPADVVGAYALRITSEKLEVWANDEDGLYYAKQTLSQLLSDEVSDADTAQRDPFPDMEIFEVAKLGKLRMGEVVDWPDVPHRGVVEGYYGAPWSAAARRSQFEFCGRNKMNIYIYAPKDDPFHHGEGCYKPYPPEKARELRDLVECARSNHVRFVWAVHPANTVRWQENDGKVQMDALCRKLEWMYELGVRDFAVLFDDTGGEIGKAQRQVQVANYIVENFIRKHPDVTQQLIVCPTGYNRSWAKEEDLRTLGRGLAPEVLVFWTGDTVVHDITMEGQQWVMEQLGRPTFVWWNWPCNDFKSNRLSMGRTYGLAQEPDMKRLLSGFVANPMEQAEASKVGLFSVADYTWNITRFDSQTSWEQAIARLYPQYSKEMQCFCEHNSYLLPNTHGYDREESVRSAHVAESFNKSLKEGKPDSVAADQLIREYGMMRECGLRLLSAGLAIGEEIKPWLESFVLTGELGGKAVRLCLAKNDDECVTSLGSMLETVARLRGIKRERWNGTGKTPVADVEVAAYALTPTMQTALHYVGKRAYASLCGGKVDELSSPAARETEAPFARHDIPHAPAFRVKQRDDGVELSRVMEVYSMQPGNFIEIVFPDPVRLDLVEVNLEDDEIAKWARLELITPDGERIHLQPVVAGSRLTLRNPSSQSVCAVRLVQTDDSPHQVALTQFRVALSGDEEKKIRRLLTDHDLATFVDCGEAAVDVHLPCPAGTKQVLVVGSAKSNIEGASLQRQEKNKSLHRFILSKPTKYIHLTAPQAADQWMSEVIFK